MMIEVDIEGYLGDIDTETLQAELDSRCTEERSSFSEELFKYFYCRTDISDKFREMLRNYTGRII